MPLKYGLLDVRARAPSAARTVAIPMDTNDSSSVTGTPPRMNGTTFWMKTVSRWTVAKMKMTRPAMITTHVARNLVRQTRLRRSRDAAIAVTSCWLALIAAPLPIPPPLPRLIAMVVPSSKPTQEQKRARTPSASGRAPLANQVGSGRLLGDVLLQPLRREARQRAIGVHVGDDLVERRQHRLRIRAALVQGER